MEERDRLSLTRSVGSFMRSRIALLLLTTGVLAVTLVFVGWVGRRSDRLAWIRAQPDFVPRISKLEAIDCSGESVRAFRMKLPSAFSWKVRVPASGVSLTARLCNLSDRDVRFRLRSGSADKKSAAKIYESDPIAPGASGAIRVPLTMARAGETRLFFEVLGEGCCEVAWSHVRLTVEP